VVAVLASFTQFGFWQLRRHAERAAANEVTLARAAAAPVPLDEALAAAAAEVAAGGTAEAALRDRRVVVTGAFEPEDEVLRRPVSRDGMAGTHVVTPLRLHGDPDGRRLWVERGWVPEAFGAVPVAEAPPPSGMVEVIGWLRATTRPPVGWVAAIAPRDPPTGRLATVAYLDPDRLAGQVAGPLVPAVLRLEAIRPAAAAASAAVPAASAAVPAASAAVPAASAAVPAAAPWPLPPEPPRVSAGPHLGYAVQWFAFALVTLVGYAALLRRVARGG